MWLTAQPLRHLCFPLTVTVPATEASPICNCSLSNTQMATTLSQTQTQTPIESPKPNPTKPSLLNKRKRYRKLYPGESTGITEEMRFVAMKLGHVTPSHHHPPPLDTWQPSLHGFLGYLVDNHLVFTTLERLVDQSEDVSYVYMRKTGLERSEALRKDLEWFEGEGCEIPDPSPAGLSYVKYLNELAETSAPLFLSHFYNIYFSHIAAGQVVAKKVSEKLLQNKELEFYRWEGDVEELLKGVRDKLNMLSEHWTRDERNRCLKETTKSFRSMGEIVRLIVSQIDY